MEPKDITLHDIITQGCAVFSLVSHKNGTMTIKMVAPGAEVTLFLPCEVASALAAFLSGSDVHDRLQDVRIAMSNEDSHSQYVA